MAKAGWFKTGGEGAAEGKKVDADAERRRQEARDENVIIKKRRLWLPPDSSIHFTFLDSIGWFIREHNLYIGGSYLHWETCLSDFDNCPLCDAGMQPAYVVAFTGIDHSEYTLKKGPNAGQVVKNTKRLAVFKSTARNKVLKKKEQREGDLVGCTFEISRFGAKDNSTGSDLEFVKRCTTEELKAFAPAMLFGKTGTMEPVDPNEWIKPFNYEEVFNPKSAEDLLVIIGGAPPVGSEADTKNTQAPSDKGDIGRYL